MKIFWFIPTHGDSRYLGTSKGARQVDHAYMKQIAVAVDNLGYEGVLIPTGRSCEDPWLTAASLIDATKKLKFLVALRPGVDGNLLNLWVWVDSLHQNLKQQQFLVLPACGSIE